MRNKKLVLVILGGILLACVVLCALVYLLPTPEPTPVAIEPTEALATETSTQIPADTPAPTATPVDTFTPELPTPTSVPTDAPLPPTDRPEPANTVPPKPSGLPGLTQADVKLNLEDRGFTCSELDSDEQGGVTYYFRDCIKESETVRLAISTLSRSIVVVDTIEASATFFDGQGDDQLAADFLGFMATMPYEGSEPEQARTWVGETISKVDTGREEIAEFGGVKMRLVGPVTSRILSMGDID